MLAKEENWTCCTDCIKGLYGDKSCKAHTHDAPATQGCYEGKKFD